MMTARQLAALGIMGSLIFQADARSDQAVPLGIYRVTAYCTCEKCCGPYPNKRFANGVPALSTFGWRVVAAPKEMKFGTHLFIVGLHHVNIDIRAGSHENGCGHVVVMDRGGAITGKRLDLFIDDHETAKRFGVRKLLVYKIEAD